MEQSADRILFTQIYAIYRRWRWVFWGIILFVMIMAVVYAKTADKKFRSSTVLVAVEHQASPASLLSGLGSLGGLAALTGLGGQSGSMSIEALATLRSREFLYEFIDELDLKPVIFEDDWDAEKKEWILEADETPPTIDDAYRAFRKNILGIAEDPKTGLITLSVTWKDRELTEVWATELVDRLNSKIRERVTGDAKASLEFLKQELLTTSIVDVRQSIFKLMEAEIQKIMLASVQEQYAFRVIDPAKAPDADRHVFPKLSIILPIALIIGSVLGVFFLAFLQFVSVLRSGSRD